jgi:Ribbon-helix-helix protein, copG family
MIRTQVSLDKQEYTLAKKEAKALGISVAEFVRRAVRDRLPISKVVAEGTGDFFDATINVGPRLS